MATARIELGRCRCPVCRNDKARLRVSEGKQLAYIHCNACNVQVFARSDRSDELLRGMHIAEAAAAAPSPAPSPVVVPSVAEEKPTPTPAPPAADKQRAGWGIFGA